MFVVVLVLLKRFGLPISIVGSLLVTVLVSLGIAALSRKDGT